MPKIFLVRECESDGGAVTTGDEDYEIGGVPIPEKITDGVSGVIQYLQNPRPDLDWDTGLSHYFMQRTGQIGGLPPPPVLATPATEIESVGEEAVSEARRAAKRAAAIAAAKHEPATPFAIMVEDTDYVGPDAKEGAVCNCDFFAEEEEEISIQLDETVYILDDYGDGWTKVARITGESGDVPSAYLDKTPLQHSLQQQKLLQGVAKKKAEGFKAPPEGWKRVESRSRPGEFVYENVNTEARQAWFPTEAAVATQRRRSLIISPLSNPSPPGTPLLPPRRPPAAVQSVPVSSRSAPLLPPRRPPVAVQSVPVSSRNNDVDICIGDDALTHLLVDGPVRDRFQAQGYRIGAPLLPPRRPPVAVQSVPVSSRSAPRRPPVAVQSVPVSSRSAPRPPPVAVQSVPVKPTSLCHPALAVESSQRVRWNSSLAPAPMRVLGASLDYTRAVHAKAFTPMEDRGQISDFKAACKAAATGAGVSIVRIADLRMEARSYLKGELEALRSSADPETQTKALQKILDESEKVHLLSYQAVMEGVVNEALFEEMITLTNVVNDKAALQFGEKPRQRPEAARDVTVLYADGACVSDAFLRFVHGLRDKTHNKELHVQQYSGNIFTEYDNTVKKLVLKNEARVLVKTGLQPDEEGANFNCEYCCDIVRAGLAFVSVADIKCTLEMILACDATIESELDRELLGDLSRSIRITRIKNRFANPTSGGWGDVMVNFYFEKDPQKHIVELQLMHDRMMTVRKKQGAHAAYNQARTAAELLEALGVQRLPPRSTPARKPGTQKQLIELKETVNVLETKNEILEEKLEALQVHNSDLQIKAEISELELLSMNITLPLRYDDGQLLDLDFDDQDKVIEKNDKLTNVAHADALMTKNL
eukprot:gene2571-2804_t